VREWTAIGEDFRQSQCGSQSDYAAHARPTNDENRFSGRILRLLMENVAANPIAGVGAGIDPG